MECACYEVILPGAYSQVILGYLLNFSINISSAIFSGMGMRSPKIFIDPLCIDGRVCVLGAIYVGLRGRKHIGYDYGWLQIGSLVLPLMSCVTLSHYLIAVYTISLTCQR